MKFSCTSCKVGCSLKSVMLCCQLTERNVLRPELVLQAFEWKMSWDQTRLLGKLWLRVKAGSSDAERPHVFSSFSFLTVTLRVLPAVPSHLNVTPVNDAGKLLRQTKSRMTQLCRVWMFVHASHKHKTGNSKTIRGFHETFSPNCQPGFIYSTLKKNHLTAVLSSQQSELSWNWCTDTEKSKFCNNQLLPWTNCPQTELNHVYVHIFYQEHKLNLCRCCWYEAKALHTQQKLNYFPSWRHVCVQDAETWV